MKGKKIWIDLSILNLCVVAFLGMTLRSKILFSLSFIDYNHLIDAHAHFAFGAWVTLALTALLVFEILPESLHKKAVYQWLFGGIVFCSWGMLLSFYFMGYGSVSVFLSTLFILVTYVFGYVFIKDVRQTAVSKTILLLSISSLVCLILSSAGQIMLAYLFSRHSLNGILYRDALFTYFHFQYNGFFTLAVFALLFHKIETVITAKERKNIYRFCVLLCTSIIPSLFLSYLWQDPYALFRIIAVAGCILVLLCLIRFVFTALSLLRIRKSVTPVVRYLGILSMSAFMLKLILQSGTIFPSIGNKVFGDRPIIIGFLHLVFLVFVSLFILAWFGQTGLLNIKNKFTRIALAVFTLGVVLNEGFLMAQGLVAMFIKSSYLFPWLLWVTSIFLFAGALMVLIARINTKINYRHPNQY